MTTSTSRRRPTRRRSSRILTLAASAALVAVALAAPPAIAETVDPIAPTAIGTLGGSEAGATAVSGDIVVGTSDTDGGWGAHAFAYDLNTGAWEDLGTLGGPASEAADVDGNLVVGNTYTADYARHAFAYDLGAAEPQLRDLGTLGGSWSYATGVDGNLVVGYSADAAGVARSFVYDLGAAEPQMTALDTGAYSYALAVDGDVVVGYYFSDTQGVRPFAYDLVTGQMTDLGTLGGYDGRAYGVYGDIVVGASQINSSGTTRAFYYDLGAASPQITALGTLGGTHSWAEDVDGNRIVGYSNNASGIVRGFAYDLTTGLMTELAGLGETHASHGMGVDGDIVVGDNMDTVGGWVQSALVWQLPPSDSTPPEVSLTVAPDPVLQGLSATATFSATDLESEITDQSCESSFAVDTSVAGEHGITCSATSAGGTSTADYTYTVLSPTEAIADLRDDVLDLVTANTRPYTSLLDNATKSLSKSDSDGAVDQLTAFMSAVNAQSGKKIPADVAALLVGQAEMIIASIEATS